MKNKIAIPKRLGHIWIGDRKPPLEWMQTWKDKHPDWEYVLFDNDFLTGRTWKNQRLIVEYYKRRSYEGVADLMRYEILHRYGGFIPEADSVCLRPCDELFEERALYTVYESENIKPDMVSPFLASVPGHPFLRKTVRSLHAKFNDDPEQMLQPWKSVGNRFLRDLILENKPQKLVIFPSVYFVPNFKGRTSQDMNKAYADQLWGNTLRLYEENSRYDRRLIYKTTLEKLKSKLKA